MSYNKNFVSYETITIFTENKQTMRLFKRKQSANDKAVRLLALANKANNLVNDVREFDMEFPDMTGKTMDVILKLTTASKNLEQMAHTIAPGIYLHGK